MQSDKLDLAIRSRFENRIRISSADNEEYFLQKQNVTKNFNYNSISIQSLSQAKPVTFSIRPGASFQLFLGGAKLFLNFSMPPNY